MKITSFVAPASAVALVSIAVSAASLPIIASAWKDKDIKIDGVSAEWAVLTGLDEGMAVGAFNDDRDLFLAVSASDWQRRRQLAASGLIVWLDVTGGKKTTFGIQIPGEGFQRGTGQFGGAAGRNGGPRGGAGGDEAGTAQDAPPPAPHVAYVDVLGPGKDDRRRVALADESGIEVAAGLNEGLLVYELRIPLAASASPQRIGLGAKLDHPLGIGLETPNQESRGGQRNSGGGFGGGGRGGGFGGGGRGGGMRGGGGGGGMQRGAFAQMKPVKLWTTLTLARAGR